jgi:hypothetical protein
MRTRRRRVVSDAALAGLLVGAVLGCTAPSPFDAEPPGSGTTDGSGPTDSADGGDPDADPPSATPDRDVPPDPEVSACNDAVVVAARETIGGQIDAFDDADFDRALTFASRRFQAEVEPEIFEAIIVAQYPVLLAEPDTQFGPCVQVTDLARIEVTVTGSDGVRDALVYLLVREEGRWSIDGATSVEEPQRELV